MLYSNNLTWHANINLLRKFLYCIFVFFVFFPYIKFVDLGTDMQPYSLILALLLFFTFKLSLNFSIILIAFVFLASIIMLMLNGISFDALRSFFNYSSLFFVSYVSFKVLKTGRINLELFLKSAVLLWFFVGFIQTFFYRGFLNFLVSHARTTDDRGVIGLAPEPTFYGIVLIFFQIILIHSSYVKKNVYIALCVVGIVLFAKSSMAILFLFIMLAYYTLTHLSIKYTLLTVVVFLTLPTLISEYFVNTRISFLISKLLDNPEALVLVDASVHDRFFHVFFSLKGFIDNHFLPSGFSSWVSYISMELPKYSNFVIVEWFTVGTRIMSGYGAAFYELGFFTFFIPFALMILYVSIYRDDFKKIIFFFLFINTIMLSAIQIGFSLFAFYIGYLSYLAWRKNIYGIESDA